MPLACTNRGFQKSAWREWGFTFIRQLLLNHPCQVIAFNVYNSNNNKIYVLLSCNQLNHNFCPIFVLFCCCKKVIGYQVSECFVCSVFPPIIIALVLKLYKSYLLFSCICKPGMERTRPSPLTIEHTYKVLCTAQSQVLSSTTQTQQVLSNIR